MSSYPDPPDFGPVLNYPSAGSEVGPLWRILWHMLCQADEPVPVATLVTEGCAAYENRTGRKIAPVTATNLLQGAELTGHLVQERLGRCRKPAYRLPGGTDTELVL